MQDEIILRNDLRPVGIILCIFGLIGAVGFVLLSIFGSFATQNEAEIHLTRIMGFVGIGAFVWKIITLNEQKNFLETSKDGIKIFGNVTKYIPWENIKDIGIEQATPGPDPESENYSPLMKPRLNPVMYLELHRADKILFESKVQKFSARKIDRLIRDLAELDNRIPLDVEFMTANTQEEICEMLRVRWRRAVSE
ncbi:hypothetical protein [Desulfovibrio sp. JC010]|uniref:hypothetical protein n=1 Tax=Desulfovibrio sp. JC010 TaxID=2593641 RepID=UPI0013D7EECB|nr:hypothetical protein [Desulfovibrio sp. JC010]NDV27579.1 hypothetical protein [Desulfovibrio sp. JC010]